MSLQSPRERPQSESFTFNFEDAHTERFSLDDHMYEQTPLRESEDTTSAISSNISSLQTRNDISTTEASKDACPRNHDDLHKVLKKSSYQMWFSIPMDVLMSLIPLFFMGKFTFYLPGQPSSELTRIAVIAGLCLALNSKPMSSYGENLKAITLLSPTIFPIVYAAILGKMLRRVGLFKAERSATIGVRHVLNIQSETILIQCRLWSVSSAASHCLQLWKGSLVYDVSISLVFRFSWHGCSPL
jgi:hypothetical protein